MIRPTLRSIMPSMTRCTSPSGVAMFWTTPSSKPSRVTCRKGLGGGPPLLLTRMSGFGAAASKASWPALVETSATTATTVAPVEARIADVNADLGLVILDQGARQGVRYGLPLTVMRDRRRVARIRVVDVRERVAGAAVEEAARGDYPQTGDRAVLIRPEGP